MPRKEGNSILVSRASEVRGGDEHQSGGREGAGGCSQTLPGGPVAGSGVKGQRAGPRPPRGSADPSPEPDPSAVMLFL